MIVSHFVDQDVVDEAAVLVEQAGVVRLSDLQLGHGVGGGKVDEFGRFRSADLDLAHMADIEEADGFADGVVLVDQARVLNGHVPAAEVDHFGTTGTVDVVQRRALKLGGRH